MYSCSTTNKMHLLSQIIYSCKTLYMFRTVFPSIIRSSKLRIQQRYMSNSCCYRGWDVTAGIKRLGREVNHSPPSIAEVLTERGYKLSSSKSIQGMERGKLTFTVRHSSLYFDCHAYVSSKWRPHNNYSNTITHRVLQVYPTALNFTDVTWIDAALHISLREHWVCVTSV